MLSELCLRSKAHWGYDADFIARCREELTLTADDLRATDIMVAEDAAGRVRGVAQVSWRGEEAWLEKLFVEPDQLRCGVGRRLYAWSLATAKARGAHALIVESDPGAESFYLRMGAVRAGVAPSGSIAGRVLPRLVHPTAELTR